jgi:hypothetical protein
MYRPAAQQKQALAGAPQQLSWGWGGRRTPAPRRAAPLEARPAGGIHLLPAPPLLPKPKNVPSFDSSPLLRERSTEASPPVGFDLKSQ